MKSKFGQDLVQSTFADLFDGIKSLETIEAGGVGAASMLQQPGGPVLNITNFTEPPERRVEIPADPCDGAPYPTIETKRASKCVLSPGNCYKLQERFLNIQSGMQDEKDNLLDSIKELNEYKEEVENNINQEIDDAKRIQGEAETKLAKATEAISDAMKIARTTWEKNSELDGKLKSEMK